jgi:hypothetical protein
MGGVSALKKVRPLAEVRGMARAVKNWRRRSLGQGGMVRCAVARRPWAGWMAVRPAVAGGEDRRRWGSGGWSLMSPNLTLSRLSAGETFVDMSPILSYIHMYIEFKYLVTKCSKYI